MYHEFAMDVERFVLAPDRMEMAGRKERKPHGLELDCAVCESRRQPGQVEIYQLRDEGDAYIFRLASLSRRIALPERSESTKLAVFNLRRIRKSN